MVIHVSLIKGVARTTEKKHIAGYVLVYIIVWLVGSYQNHTVFDMSEHPF